MPPFHAGELRVQEQAGVRERASRVGNGIRQEIPPAAADFLAERRWVVLATADGSGRPWASLLSGAPGFARAEGTRVVRLDAHPAAGDPLAGYATDGAVAGLLAIDPPNRQRMRVNGTLERAAQGLLLHAEQVYANCPKYIHPHEADPSAPAAAPARRTDVLSERQRDWIRGADTFFIATVNPGEGADASHRGGPPGFVRVEGSRLVWPDYRGNMMYNTLGNIAAHGRAGLLFLDLVGGGRLMLSGTARIDWDAARAAAVPEAERLVELEVEAVVELEGASEAA